MSTLPGVGLECRELSKWFPTRNGDVHALESASFRITAGEFVSILGPSGCGKTTLLRIVAGLLPPSTGEVRFEGVPSAGEARVALAFQEHGLFPWMTVLENVAFALEDYDDGSKSRQEVARSFVDQVGLGRYSGLYPQQLSRGMRQRVNIARAFARNPQVLMLDEPFASLDAQSRRVLQEELMTRWRQHSNTVIFVTHDIEEAVLLADRVLLMSGAPGRIVEEHDIGLPRPRDLDAWESTEVREIRRSLWLRLAAETRQSLAIAK